MTENGSIEKQARRALRRMIFYRVLGELMSLPQVIIQPLRGFFKLLGDFFRQMELAIFQLELDAARRYKLLTGLDLPTAAGDPGRYGALDAQRNETLQNRYMEQATGEE